MKPKTTTRGGVEANSINFNRHSINPVHVLYMDHIQYLYSNPILYGEPDKREILGWIIRENEKAFWILCDKPLKSLSFRNISLEYSGFLILKSTILAIEKLDLPLPTKYNTEKSTETKVEDVADH